MGRPKNRLKTLQLTISTTRPVLDSLNELVQTGLFGKNPAEAAERLIARGIENLRKEELIRTSRKQIEKQKLLWGSS